MNADTVVGEGYTVPASELAKGITTPLTYGDGLELIHSVLGRLRGGHAESLPAVVVAQLAHVLMAVDTASRQQAQEPMVAALEAFLGCLPADMSMWRAMGLDTSSLTMARIKAMVALTHAGLL